MLLNIFFLSISIVFGVAFANPVALAPQPSSDIIDYSTDLVIQENPFPLIFQRIGGLTGYQKSALSVAVNTVYWVVTNYSTIISAVRAIVRICSFTNQCMGLEQFVPIGRIIRMVTPEHLETAKRFLITFKKK